MRDAPPYSSPRRRGPPFFVDDRLTDRDYGQWAGDVRTDVEGRWGSVDDAPGVQPVNEILTRATSALNSWADVVDPIAPEVIVLVTHDAVIRPVLHGIDATIGVVRAAEGSYQVLRRADGRWSIVELDHDPGFR